MSSRLQCWHWWKESIKRFILSPYYTEYKTKSSSGQCTTVIPSPMNEEMPRYIMGNVPTVQPKSSTKGSNPPLSLKNELTLVVHATNLFKTGVNLLRAIISVKISLIHRSRVLGTKAQLRLEIIFN